MGEIYTFDNTPDHEPFAKLCGPNRRIRAIIGVSLDHLITSPLIDIATTILCPGTPGLEDAKFRPIGAGRGTDIVMFPVGQAWSTQELGDVVLLEVDADANDVLHFYSLEPGGEPWPAPPPKPQLRIA